MSGDNAIIIGMAVAGLPAENRTRIIFWGVVGATVLRLGFAAVTTELLQIIGLTLAGGLLSALGRVAHVSRVAFQGPSGGRRSRPASLCRRRRVRP